VLDFLWLFVGLALLLAGGEMLVRGSSALARELGVSPLVIGLTVVAVNVTAAWRGDATLSFGNVIGSNIANIGLILATAALVRSLEVRGTVISREIPMMLVATLAVIFLGLDRIVATQEAYNRSDGLVLLLFFAIFLYYTAADVLRGRQRDPVVQEAKDVVASTKLHSIGKSIAVAVVGLIGLVAGAELTVGAAVALATALGLSNAVIGLTLVAIGTSLPELATSLMAVRSGQLDLAVGNVVGSNIFNLLFILGTTATIRAVPLPEGGAADLAVLAVLSAALLTVSLSQRQRIVRLEGLALLVAYVGYSVWRVMLS